MRNPEIARLLFVLLGLFLIGVLVAVAALSVSLRLYTAPLLHNQAAVVGAVLASYPEAEAAVIRQLKEVDEETFREGQAVLSRYGYGSRDFVFETELMQRQSRLQTFLYVSMTVCMFAALVTVFLIFLHRRYRTVHQLNDYARSIAEGRDTMDIRDNGEGEFSMLKNEIYKITTMLKEQTAALQREKLNLSDSIADISHQLKTPMTSLSVMTDLLMDEPSEEMRAEFLRRIRSQLDRLEWLVSSLLTLSRLDAGAITMKTSTFPVHQVISKALDTLSIPIEIKQHQTVVSGDASILMSGDPEWIAEALINILKNCIEHTPEHGKIRIEYEDNPIFTRMTIADNGEGIEAGDLPYIFNRFYKGKNAGDDSVGIGLAMAHAIIKRHNGDINVRSEKGIGTAFIITFYKKRI